MSVTLEITGTEQLAAAMAAIGERARPAAASGLFVEGEEVVGDAKEHYVPVDLGPLRDSGHVGLPEISGDEIAVRVGFGGAAADYALAVHEHLSEHSPPSWVKAEAGGRPVQFSPTGHGPKYLERPLLARAGGFVARMAERMRGAMGL